MKKTLDPQLTAKIPQPAVELMQKFSDAGFEIYLVGGAVRDLLLDRSITDCDFTTNATPEEILKILPDGFYDNVFGTVGLVITTDEDKYEITTYRTEQGYADKRHPDVVSWGKTLEDDLKRRDFTMNSMAIGLLNSNDKSQIIKQIPNSNDKNTEDIVFELIDLYGGQEDLENKVIRAVGEVKERFAEDALRLMRAVRFASQLGFTIEEKMLQAIMESAPLLVNISTERVRDELFKLLVAPGAYEGVDLLRTTGLLDYIIPELTKAYGVAQARHHIYDVWTHSLMAMKNCPSTDPIVKLATLIHDVGKPYVVSDEGTVRTFYNHELVSARIAKQLGERLRLSRAQADKLWHLVRYHQFTVDEKQTDSAIRRFIRKVEINNLYDMLDLRTGDRLGGGAKRTSWRLEEFKARLVEVQKQPFSVADLKVDGNDVMQILGIKPGPKVGQILNEIFTLVEAEEIPNEREIQLQKIKMQNQYQVISL